ncbi:MAG: hypothetical protein RIQ93_2098 [Verrucomicrobiota bacterium]
MDFSDFVELALYHPEVGYYRQPRRRVGYAPGTDFFTASSSGPIFGELVVAACVELLGKAIAHQYTFVEIGAEAGLEILTGVDHPFAASRAVQVGEALNLKGRCIVFSNELFDAQPFRRLIFRGNSWREQRVVLRGAELEEIETPFRQNFPALPLVAPEGYLIDAPIGAAALADSIAAEPWTGLFVAADYGKSWRELIEVTPAGTARAYFRHSQSNDLLARPGEQDLTCHVCWDWLAAALTRKGFSSPTIESQESFFVSHAGEFIGREVAKQSSQFSQRKLALLQLLHPSHLGQKFQVMHSIRQ